MFRCMLAVAVATVVLGGAAAAQTCSSLPYNLQNGQSADAVQLMANFNCLKNSPIFNGPVGIGVANPTSALFVNGAIAAQSGTSAFQLDPGNNRVTLWTNGAFSSAAPYSNWSSTLTITSGNVGIGTTTPLRHFVVAGSDDARVNIYSNGGSVAAIDAVANSDGSVGRWLAINPTGGNVGIGTTTAIREFVVAGRDDARVNIYSNGGSVAAIDAVANTDGSVARWLAINPTGGNVGIGTTSPAATLDVQNSANLVARFKGNVSSATNYIRVDSQYGAGYFGTYGNYPAILADGVNPAYYYDGNNNISWLRGQAWASSFYAYSDGRLKTNIQPLGNALALVDRLRPVRYQFRDPSDRPVGKSLPLARNSQVGLIAQEVQTVVPEAVTADKDGVYGINQAELVPVLIQAIKELHAEVEGLKAKLGQK